MDLARYIMLVTTLLFLTANAYAGRDPIGWSQTGTLPASSTLNHSYSINFTLTNNLSFTMPTALEISNNSTPSSEVTMVDNCSGLKLTPGQTCNVGLVLIPKTAGTKKLSVFMEYGKNKVMIPKSALTSTTASAASSLLQGTASIGFPVSILSSTTYPLSFTFTNNGTTSLGSLALSQAAGNSSGYTQSSSTCTGTLAAGASCVVTGSFITTAASGSVTVGYTLTSGSVSGNVTTSSIISSSAKGVRTVTFVNNCSQTVWFGLVGGAVNSNPCKTTSQCSQGSFCDPAANAGAGECFYGNPVPTANGGSYQLAASGDSRSVAISDYDLQYVWSGNMAARTGASCATGTCDTADCASGGGNHGCPVGRGFDQPATLAEFTMQRDTVDSYDVSMINGVNVGVQITPSTTYSGGIVSSQYSCSSPGQVTQTTAGLGGCSWTFTPPSFPDATSPSSYVYVKAPASPTACTTANESTVCTSAPNTTCGLTFNSSTTTLSKVCGERIGYLSQNQVCSFANTNLTPGSTNNPGDAYFPCDTQIASMPSFTYWGLFACKAQANGDLGTCYNTSANPPASTANCCGCVDWQNVGGGIVVPSYTSTCVNTNNSWTGASSVTPSVQGGLEWLKKACPTAYSYPFDDKSSGFSCSDINGSHTTNTVNYTITFCPA